MGVVQDSALRWTPEVTGVFRTGVGGNLHPRLQELLIRGCLALSKLLSNFFFILFFFARERLGWPWCLRKFIGKLGIFIE